MKPTRTIRRLASVLAVLASAVLASLAAAPAAFASTSPGPAGPAGPALGQLPPPSAGWNKHPPLPGPAGVHAALAGGMPGWQITLIATAAIVIAAAAVLLARARSARQHVTATAA